MRDALVKNAADEGQVKEAQLREKLNDEKEVDDIFFIMNSVPGRRYIYGLIEFCGVFVTSFTGDERTYYNEGQRNVGLRLIADIQESCPELFGKMIEENKGEKVNGRVTNTKRRNR